MKPKSALRSFLILTGSSLLAISTASAQSTLYWDGGVIDIETDGDGSSGGTAGTWDTAIKNWDAGAAPHVAWVNSNNDTAVFGGTAGIVTLGANVTVGGLTFNTNTYSVAPGTGPFGITFGVPGNINVSTGTSTISAVISGGAITKTGAGTLKLAAINTFSSLTLGGGFAQAGTNSTSAGNDAFGAADSTISVTANSTINYDPSGVAYTFAKAVDLASGVTLTYVKGAAGSHTYQGVLSGGNNTTVLVNDAGSIAQRTLIFSNPANTFTGTVDLSNNQSTVSFSSLSDATGAGNIKFGIPTAARNGAFQLDPTAVAPLVLNNRKIEVIAGASASGTAQINNLNTTATNTLTIGSDLLVTGTGGTKTLQLGGVNTGNNTFSGVIADGTGTVISLTKADAGIWTISGTNTYTGTTAVNGGVLKLGSAGALGGGNLNFNGGVLGLAAGNFSRALGTAAGEFQFQSGGGGFAAYGANRNVSPGTLTWSTTVGTQLVGTLFLSAADSDATVIWTSNISLGGGSRTVSVANGSASTDAQINGVLSTAGSLTKSGAGTLRLTSSSSSYTGTTTVTGGVLEVTNLANGGENSAIGAATSNVVLGSGTTLRYVGTAPAGHSTDRGFTANGTANGNNAVLDASGVGPVSFTNTASPAYGSNNQSRFLQLTGTNTGANTLAANIANNGSGAVNLTKNGSGTWVLTGTNVYTGGTAINDGVLQAVHGTSLPASSTLQLRGGVLQSSGTISRTVGTASGNVNWATGSGGFAAKGAPLTLNLDGGTGSLTWNASSFVSDGQALIFGSSSADDLVDFQNSINLGSGAVLTRTITVNDNVSSVNDRARISGNLTNTTSGMNLLKNGAGTLELTGTNTYDGTTTVAEGTLALIGGSQASAITVNAGASLGFTLGSPTTSTASVDLTNGTVRITGTVDNASDYLLMTASAITGTPVLADTIPNYQLQKVPDGGNTQLKLVYSTGSDPYLTWAGAGAAFDADANNDGVSNGLAWLLGAANKDVNALGLLPEPAQSSGNLVLEFDCLPGSERGGAVLSVEYSDDLGSWAGTEVPATTGTFTAGVVGFTVTDPEPAGGLLNVVATIPAAEAASGKLFGRLKAVKP